MLRRALLAGLCVAAMLPLTALAQQDRPVIGFTRSSSFATAAHLVAAFRDGLKGEGFVDGRNVTIEFHAAEDRHDRLPAMMAGLASRPVAVIVGNSPAALAARAATTTVPIVFTTGADPVAEGLVASLNRPGGNATGVVFFATELAAKRLEFLRQFVPGSTTIAALTTAGWRQAVFERTDLEAAARAVGVELVLVEVGEIGEVERAFGTFVARRAGALFVGSSPLFTSHRARLVELAARHRLPAMYNLRDSVVAGGLMSYGSSNTDAYRQAGIYAGRILKGERPADLPVIQSSKFEFVINSRTAKALGLAIPDRLLALADEVLE